MSKSLCHLTCRPSNEPSTGNVRMVFPGTNLTRLERVPEILTEIGHRERQPYPLDEREQQLLFSELAPYAAEMATFARSRIAIGDGS